MKFFVLMLTFITFTGCHFNNVTTPATNLMGNPSGIVGASKEQALTTVAPVAKYL